MPESRRRRKQAYTPPPQGSDPETTSSKRPIRISGARWVAPVMVAMFIIGLVWIVVWYIAPENPLMGPLAGWNVAIGFVFIGIGFLLSTKWE